MPFRGKRSNRIECLYRLLKALSVHSFTIILLLSTSQQLFTHFVNLFSIRQKCESQHQMPSMKTNHLLVNTLLIFMRNSMTLFCFVYFKYIRASFFIDEWSVIHCFSWAISIWTLLQIFFETSNQVFFRSSTYHNQALLIRGVDRNLWICTNKSSAEIMKLERIWAET
jgi:hypothetical protein